MDELYYIIYGLGAICLYLGFKLKEARDANADLAEFIHHLVSNQAEVIKIVKKGGDENAPPF